MKELSLKKANVFFELDISKHEFSNFFLCSILSFYAGKDKNFEIIPTFIKSK